MSCLPLICCSVSVPESHYLNHCSIGMCLLWQGQDQLPPDLCMAHALCLPGSLACPQLDFHLTRCFPFTFNLQDWNRLLLSDESISSAP